LRFLVSYAKLNSLTEGSDLIVLLVVKFSPFFIPLGQVSFTNKAHASTVAGWLAAQCYEAISLLYAYKQLTEQGDKQYVYRKEHEIELKTLPALRPYPSSDGDKNVDWDGYG
jgi:hypothetical protein